MYVSSSKSMSSRPARGGGANTASAAVSSPAVAPAKTATASPTASSSPPPSAASVAQSSAAHLANASINLVAIREYARKELVRILDAQRGGMTLVIDKSLSGPLSLVAEPDLLTLHGANEIYHLGADMKTDNTNVLYLVRPTIENMKLIAGHITSFKKNDRTGARRVWTIQFVPRRTVLCERVLAEEGVFGDVRTGEFQLELIPFDDDVLSLEMGSTFRELFLDGDPSKLFYVARSLMRLQSIFGLIPNIKGKGANALKVWQLMQRMRREQPTTAYNATLPEIDTLILIDRQVDTITPFMTQLTYEGLIDEIFGINNSLINVDYEVLGEKKEGKKKLLLNSNDGLFKEIRDLNFRVLGPLLHKRAEGVAETYEKRHKVTQSVGDMQIFMGEFKTAHADHQFLQNHINLAERISQTTKSKRFDQRIDWEWAMLEGRDADQCDEYIEGLIAKQEDLALVLRLLVLFSQTHGVKPKRFDYLKREIVQAYGFEHMFTLNNLERLGLFTRMPKRNVWPAVRKALRLTNERDKLDLQAPKDFYHVITGYCPLSVRLIEIASRPGGWKRTEEILSLLPGKHFEVAQELPASLQDRARLTGEAMARVAEGKGVADATSARPKMEAPKAGQPGVPAKVPAKTAGGPATPAGATGSGFAPGGGSDLLDAPATPSNAAANGTNGGKLPLTLVYFLGGVTFSEISALRYLAAKEGHGRDYIIATTKLINGSSLVDSVCEHIQNNLRRPSVPPSAGSSR